MAEVATLTMQVILTAKQANARSAANQQSALDLVLVKITEASNNGQTSVIVDALSEYAEGILKDNGYTIGRINALQNLGVNISWDQAK